MNDRRKSLTTHALGSRLEASAATARSCTLLAWVGVIATIMALTDTAALALDKALLEKQVTETLEHFYSLGRDNKFLAQNAIAVLVFPNITKAGIGVAVEHGNGVLLENGKMVGYYSISGGSIGLTLGASRHSEVILLNSPEAREQVVKGSEWSIGADASVAVINMGAGGFYDLGMLEKPVLAFVFGEKGLMGDASLKGSKIGKVK